MRLKFLTYLIFVLCTAQVSFGQSVDESETTRHNFKHDIGLNSIGLLSALFDGDDAEFVTPYLVSYNLDMGKTNIRAAIGPKFSTSTVVREGFTDTQQQIATDIDYRLGLGWDIIDEPKWLVRSGVDMVGSYTLDKLVDDTGFDKITNQDREWTLGGGPFVQIVFRISDRISLSTDAALYFTHFNSQSKEIFENFPEFDNVISNTTGQELGAFLPTSLFIHFHF